MQLKTIFAASPTAAAPVWLILPFEQMQQNHDEIAFEAFALAA